jgi:hypothetical protein
MRYERFCINTIFLFAIACSRESPAPPSATTTATTTVAPPAAVTTSAAPVPDAKAGSYDEAMIWLRNARAFHFVIDEAGVHAEGGLTRLTYGSESIQIRVNGEEWRAASGPRGVTWERRKGTSWTAADAPVYGNRLYQRVTLGFDPQKKEGAAQHAGIEGGTNHYRFTDANTGEVHDVWVNATDGHVERMTIGDSFELKIDLDETIR